MLCLGECSTEPAVNSLKIKNLERVDNIPSKQCCLSDRSTKPTINSLKRTNLECVNNIPTKQCCLGKRSIEPVNFRPLKTLKRRLEYEENIPPKQICLNENPSRTSTSSAFHREMTPHSAYILKKLEKQKEISIYRRKKLLALKQSCRRLTKKVASLENILLKLKSNYLINLEQEELLGSIKNKELLKTLLHKQSAQKPYSSAVRKFALYLHFISPKAYLFVRKEFDTCLPHPRTLYNWYKSVNCEPGFTQESFDLIKKMTKKSEKTKIVVSLMLDEMSIRQHLQWDGKKTVGYVDIGDNVDTDSLPIAKDALVFMVTALNGNWKLPVGYFFTNGVNGEQRSALVSNCIILLVECGVTVASLTFDGCPSNIAMAKSLGAKLDDVNNIDCTIKVAGQHIVIFPDPCHMIKLVRNTLADKINLKNGNNELISWEHIKSFHELQESEGVHLANKLRRSHIEYKNQIMKVRLAVQTFSSSLSQALLFCQKLNIREFENVGATAEFIKYFNDMFDIMNSRKLFSYGYKKPMSMENFSEIEDFLNKFVNYVKCLKINGQSVLQSGRKTGFLGLICCAQSIKTLYHQLINSPCPEMKYICTYKMSQDHLEIFFSSIRSKGGFNNNPTVIQFASAYKRLLVHGEIKINSTGNCIDLEDINILNDNLRNKDFVSKINETSRNFNLEIEDNNEGPPIDVLDEHDYVNSNLTEFSREISIYIGGFVIKKLKNQLKCEDCISALFSSEKLSKFIFHKDFGGLHFPSQDVINICVYTEKYLREILQTHGPQYFANKKNMPKVILNIFKYFGKKNNIFNSLNEHIFEQNPLDNHISLLIKAISLKYMEIRVHHVLKEISQSNKRVRNQYTKLILFKGQ